MKLLPEHDFEISILEPVEQVRQRLLENVETESTGRWFPSTEDRRFSGWVENGYFEISRKNYFFHYNQFEPLLSGTIEQHPPGTHVSVRMKLPILITVITWFLVGAAPLVAISTETVSWSLIGRVFIFYAFMMLMLHIVFGVLVKKSKSILLEIFNHSTTNMPLEPLSLTLAAQREFRGTSLNSGEDK